MDDVTKSECTAIVPYAKKRWTLAFEGRISLLVGVDLAVCIASAILFRIPLANVDDSGTVCFLAVLFFSGAAFSALLTRVSRRMYRKEFSMPRSHREAERWEFFTHRVADFSILLNGLYTGLLAAFVPVQCAMVLVFLYAAVSACRLWKSLELPDLGEGPDTTRNR